MAAHSRYGSQLVSAAAMHHNTMMGTGCNGGEDDGGNDDSDGMQWRQGQWRRETVAAVEGAQVTCSWT